tara:strand:- start:684 stop:1241 length:558 start_codon:yes stop_codon:yes gene_type:complete
MPIVINGSGTVTGLSAGGISNAKAVATAAMPAGSIIQVVTVTQSGVDSSTSTSWVDTANMTASITPQTDSDVRIDFCGCLGHTDNTAMKFRIARVKGGVTTYHGAADSSEFTMASYTGSSDPTNQHYHQSFHHIDTNPGGDGSTAITYKLQWKIDSGTIYLGRDDTGSISTYAGGNSWTLTEIRG